MMNILCYHVLFTILYMYVDGQICTVDEIRHHTIRETYMQTFFETYRKSRCYFRCKMTKISQRPLYRIVPKKYQFTRKFCCEGYISNNTDLALGLRCDPICSPACINSFCDEPGKCKCLDGYSPDQNTSHKCVPVCEKSCGHGICIAPNQCQCNYGYIYKNDKCLPICNEPCINSTCVAPDVCECLPGYRKGEDNKCHPYCSNCGHGSCVGPEICVCNEGWYMSDDNVCAPKCDPSCGFGMCIGPNECKCSLGYVNSENGTCIPHCLEGCLNGNCISPNNCVCSEGWLKLENDYCQPFCELPCGNGTCIAPNLCNCSDGYEEDESKLAESRNSSVCLPKCENCEGTCVAPNNCICEEPYYSKKVILNIDDCDCYENCSTESKKCDRIICVIDSTSSTTLTDLYEFINVTFDDDNGLSDMNTEVILEESDKLNDNSAPDRFPSWIYIAVAITVISVIFILIIVFKRRVIIHYISAGSYVVEGDNVKDSPNTHPIEMKSC